VGCESRDMERVGDEGRRREKHRAMGVGAECENDVERRVWGALAARGGLLVVGRGAGHGVCVL
jgi:hypothetical protein